MNRVLGAGSYLASILAGLALIVGVLAMPVGEVRADEYTPTPNPANPCSSGLGCPAPSTCWWGTTCPNNPNGPLQTCFCAWGNPQ